MIDTALLIAGALTAGMYFTSDTPDEVELRHLADLLYRRIDWRQGDQKVFVADITKASKLLHWHPRVPKRQGIESITEWVRSLKGAA